MTLNRESELAILVTPYLVGPSHEKNFQLPTDGYANPSDLDMYMRGRIASVYDPKKTEDDSWITSLTKEKSENDKTEAMLDASGDHIGVTYDACKFPQHF